MPQVFEIILSRNHEARLRFYHGGGALPGGSSVLRVKDGSRWWTFKCKSEGGNYFSISGPDWKSFFARNRVGDTVTLSTYGDQYIISVE